MISSVRLYVQELINHSIVCELEFPTSWKVFQNEYLLNATLLQEKLKLWEADDSRILWLLDKRDTTYIVKAIDKINYYLRHILRGDEVTMQMLGEDKDLLRAGIALEKSYGKAAGTGDNTIGKWTPIVTDTKIDFTIGTYQQFTIRQIGSTWMGGFVQSPSGNLFRFDGLAKVVTEDGSFKDLKLYYELKNGEYVILEKDKDYHVGDIIADFGFTVYEDSVLESELNPSFVDFVTGVPLNATREQVIQSYKDELLAGTLKAKYGSATTFARQDPTVIKFSYDEYETIPYTFTYNGTQYTLPDGQYTFKGGHITNIQALNDEGVALFQYDPEYDWEKDVSLNKSITSNLHIRKLTKGWFGSGKSGWSRDINSLPYIQTLDEHEWAKAYSKYVDIYVRQVKNIDINALLDLVHGDPSKFYLLFTIANLYAIRHELLSIFFRALNEIRKKGMCLK